MRVAVASCSLRAFFRAEGPDLGEASREGEGPRLTLALAVNGLEYNGR